MALCTAWTSWSRAPARSRRQSVYAHMTTLSVDACDQRRASSTQCSRIPGRSNGSSSARRRVDNAHPPRVRHHTMENMMVPTIICASALAHGGAGCTCSGAAGAEGIILIHRSGHTRDICFITRRAFCSASPRRRPRPGVAPRPGPGAAGRAPARRPAGGSCRMESSCPPRSICRVAK